MTETRLQFGEITNIYAEESWQKQAGATPDPDWTEICFVKSNTQLIAMPVANALRALRWPWHGRTGNWRSGFSCVQWPNCRRLILTGVVLINQFNAITSQQMSKMSRHE